MDESWFAALAAALEIDDEPALLAAVRPLLGPGARLTTWRRGASGWDPLHGDDRALPDIVPAEPGMTSHDGQHVALVGDDPTASRLFVLEAPALGATTAEAMTTLVQVALGRLVQRQAVASALQRLSDNERIGALGSYDWHVPTDTNRWSDQLYRIYGEVPQSFNATYERFLGFIHPDDRDRVRAIHQEAFATGEPYEMEERIVLRDGTERLLWSNGEVVMGPDGAPERFIGICRDVTDQRAAEEAAVEAERHRRAAHDADVRRRAALELNDAVVQGLTAAGWAEDMGSAEAVREVLEQTLENARSMMDDLLAGDEEGPPRAGELRRTAAPDAQIRGLVRGAGGRPDGAAATPGPDRLRVVFADDAPDVRMLLSLQLDQLGLEVVGEAANGREAVDLVAAHAPDIVLLDLSMPEMDGLEATALIRAARPDVRIVILSGYAAHTMADRAREAGADAYVEKGRDLAARLRPALAITV